MNFSQEGLSMSHGSFPLGAGEPLSPALMGVSGKRIVSYLAEMLRDAKL